MLGIWTGKFGCAPDDFLTTRSLLNVFALGSIMSGNFGAIYNLESWQDGNNQSVFRAYNVVFGLFQAPYYAFSQTMMAELTPPGFENMVCVEIQHYNPLCHRFTPYLILLSVFWTLRALEPRLLNDRPECHPSDYRPLRK